MSVQKPLANLKVFVDHENVVNNGPQKVKKTLSTITILLDNALVARHTIRGHFDAVQALNEFRRLPHTFKEKGHAYQNGLLLARSKAA